MKKIKDIEFNKALLISICSGILFFLITIIILSGKLNYSYYVSTIIGIVVGPVMFSIIFSIFDGPSKNLCRRKLKDTMIYQKAYAEVKPKSANEHNKDKLYYAMLLPKNKVLISLRHDDGFVEIIWDIIDLSEFYNNFSFI